MTNHSNEAEVLEAALSLVESWRIQGNWQDAQTLLDGLYPVAEKVNQDAVANVWLQKARALFDEGIFRGINTLEKREDSLAQAFALAESSGNESLLGDIYDALGFSSHIKYIDSDRSQEPENELDFFERGLELRRKSGTLEQVAESLFHVGLVYDVIRRDYDRALSYHEEAYKLAQEVGDKITASYAIRHIGFARLATGEFEAAEQALRESLALREEAGFTAGIAFALAALAHLETQKGDKASALLRLHQARAILESLRATARVAWVDKHIASLSEA